MPYNKGKFTKKEMDLEGAPTEHLTTGEGKVVDVGKKAFSGKKGDKAPCKKKLRGSASG